MKANGGYVMVDFTGLDVSNGEAQTIPGIHDKLAIAMTTGKPIMVCGAVNGEGVISPAFVTVTEGAGMGFTLGSFTAVVADDDSVTPVEV